MTKRRFQNITDRLLGAGSVVGIGLGAIGNPHALAPLCAALAHSDSQVRRQATAALGRLGDPRAVRPLISVLHAPDPAMRRWAAYALGNLSSREAVPALIAALQDENPEVRQAVADALGRLGDLRAVDPLFASLKQPGSRYWIVKSLAALGAAAVPALLAALSDTDKDIRFFAAEALTTIQDERTIAPLIAALDDPVINVRWKAVEALVAQSTPTLPALRVALAHPHSRIRRGAVESLGKLGDTQARAMLRHVQATDPDFEVRETAAQAIRQLERR
jgi:HEAT repeat protein